MEEIMGRTAVSFAQGFAGLRDVLSDVPYLLYAVGGDSGRCRREAAMVRVSAGAMPAEAMSSG